MVESEETIAQSVERGWREEPSLGRYMASLIRSVVADGFSRGKMTADDVRELVALADRMAPSSEEPPPPTEAESEALKAWIQRIEEGR